MQLQRAWRKKRKKYLHDLEELEVTRQQIIDGKEQVRDSPWSEQKDGILHALDDGMRRLEHSEARTRQLLAHVERYII